MSKQIKQATELTTFTSAADRIAAVVNKEDKAPRPLLAGIIKTATNNHTKELNRRLNTLQSNQKEMMEKHDKLISEHQRQKRAKKDHGNDLPWTRKEPPIKEPPIKEPLPQAAATIYQSSISTTVPPPPPPVGCLKEVIDRQKVVLDN